MRPPPARLRPSCRPLALSALPLSTRAPDWDTQLGWGGSGVGTGVPQRPAHPGSRPEGVGTSPPRVPPRSRARTRRTPLEPSVSLTLFSSGLHTLQEPSDPRGARRRQSEGRHTFGDQYWAGPGPLRPSGAPSQRGRLGGVGSGPPGGATLTPPEELPAESVCTASGPPGIWGPGHRVVNCHAVDAATVAPREEGVRDAQHDAPKVGPKTRRNSRPQSQGTREQRFRATLLSRSPEASLRSRSLICEDLTFDRDARGRILAPVH